MIEVRKTARFKAWFDRLRDLRARARIQVRIDRLSLGNPGDVAPVGWGVSEMRIDYGRAIQSISFGAARGSWSFWRAATRARRPGTYRPPSKLATEIDL
jgi:hypothetical protein